MTDSIEELGFSELFLALGARYPEGADEAFDFYRGELWGDGRYWKGPQFKGADASSQIIKEGIRRDFTSVNPARSGVRRHRRGVLGREPGWIVSVRRELEKKTDANGQMTQEEPNKEEKDLIEEAYRVIREWWAAAEAFRVFKDGFTNRLVCKRGPLRFYVPTSEFVAGPDGKRGIPRAEPVEVVKKIFLLAPHPKDATVVTDPTTMRKYSICSVMVGDKRRLEVSYVNDAGKTVVRLVDETSAFAGTTVGRYVTKAFATVSKLVGGQGAEDNTWEMPLGGRLMLVEMEGEELITQQVRENQALAAKGLTMLSHNMDMAGFRERVYLNAQPPGKTVEVADANVAGGKIKQFIPATIPEGPGARPFVQGVSYTETGADGKKTTKLATPSVVDTDPVPTKSFEDTTRIARRNILEEMDQLHIEIASESTVSGESRRQARDDYEKSLKESKLEIDRIGSVVLETVLSLAAYFSGQPGRYDGLRVTFNTHVDAGPLSSDDRSALLAEMEAHVRSVEDTREQLGIDDPDAMDTKVKEERAAAAANPAPTVPPTTT